MSDRISLYEFTPSRFQYYCDECNRLTSDYATEQDAAAAAADRLAARPWVFAYLLHGGGAETRYIARNAADADRARAAANIEAPTYII
mgnify:CR=1 FL=1